MYLTLLSVFFCIAAMNCQSVANANPVIPESDPVPPMIRVPVRPAQSEVGRFLPKERLYLPPAPRERPSLAAGRKFFCLRDDIAGLVREDGKPISNDELSLNVLVLREIADSQLTLVSEDGRRTYTLLLKTPPKDTEDIPSGIVPVLEDVESEAMRKKYEGKFVVPYPYFHLTGRLRNPEYEGGFEFTGATLRRLLRLHMTRRQSLSTGWYDFETYDPIIALFDAPYGLNVIVGKGQLDPWMVGQEVLDMARDATRSGYATCFAFFAGAWDMERDVSLVPWETMVARTSPVYRKAISSAREERWAYLYIRKGMTPDMVSWLIGWPPGYGTRKELRARSRWTYRDPATGEVSVFFRNGRVFKWFGREAPYDPDL